VHQHMFTDRTRLAARRSARSATRSCA
jgi:hypothetical protein